MSGASPYAAHPAPSTAPSVTPRSPTRETPATPPPTTWRGAAMRYGTAVLLALVALALTAGLEPMVSRTLLLFAYVAVALSARMGGTGPGLVTAVVCVLGLDYLLITPAYSLRAQDPSDLLPLALFVGVSWVIAALSGSLRVARDAARTHTAGADRATARLREQTAELEVANEQLREQAMELEAQTVELESATEELTQQSEEATQARDVAEHAADRARRLLHLAAHLNEATTRERIADVILADSVAAVGADAGSLAIVHTDPDGRPAELEIVRTAGYERAVAQRYRRFPVTPGRPLSDAVLARAPAFVGSPEEWRTRWPTVTEDLTGLGFQAFAGVPVRVGDRVLAALSFSFRSPRDFDDATRTFLTTVGEQCALALERQRLHDADVVRATLFETIQDAFIALDRELRFTYLNSRAESMLRARASELLGRRIGDAYPQGNDTPIRRMIQRTLDTREAAHGEEYSAVTRSWLAVRVFPAPDGVSLLLQDVTARRRAQEAASFMAEASRLLAQSLDYETTLRALAEAAVPRLADWCAVDMLVEPRAVGAAEPWPPAVARLAVVHQDPAKVEWARDLERRQSTDWSAPHGLARVLRAGVTEFYPSIADEMLVAAAKSPEELATLRALDFHAVIIVPLVTRGMTLGALTLVMTESGRHYDDADRALAEELARRAATAVDNARLYREAERARTQAEQARAEAEGANRAKSQFLASMSHELRTPLNAVQGYAQLLELGIHGPVTDAQRGALDRIQRAQRHLLGLIDDVLTFARIESGRVEFDVRPVQAGDVLGDVVPMIEPQLSAKGIALDVRLPGNGASLAVHADREKLAQILLNLLSNAAKFTPDGGRVTVEVCERLDDDAVAGVVFLRVADTGIGIPADKLDAVFEPFVQVRKPYAPGAGGTGLGLSISRDLARGMGGDLRARSVEGRGSAFTVALRRA